MSHSKLLDQTEPSIRRARSFPWLRGAWRMTPPAWLTKDEDLSALGERRRW
jgi:hypothetical protein